MKLRVWVLVGASVWATSCATGSKDDYDLGDPRAHNPYLESYSAYDPSSKRIDLEEANERPASGRAQAPKPAVQVQTAPIAPVAVASATPAPASTPLAAATVTPSAASAASAKPIAFERPKPPLTDRGLQVSGVPDVAAELKVWCSQMRSEMKKLRWDIEPCAEGVQWKLGGMSVLGRPLVYTVLGNENATEATLILTMVHADEITPLYIGLELVNWLKNQKDLLEKSKVVIAPLVNPDGFYKRVRTRTNARGVDVNRNFATRDWDAEALKLWKTKYGSDRRRFPGKVPESEPETVFQKGLIEAYGPEKILSIHSPLSMMDYDGPDTGIPLARFMNDYGREYLKLKHKLESLSWRFYPGSLGNYAGRELKIPTMTLELPTADSGKAKVYWEKFVEGARAFIAFPTEALAEKAAKKD
ncbi:MAG: hypothetical protein JNL01_13090 [Bdellovibrionales bacterium]|nr:hypothetical protein [Bdellovibrionales bacterium]